MRVIITALLFVCTAMTMTSQALNWGDTASIDDEVDCGMFSLDLHSDPSVYEGSYMFGFSEAEWTLEIRRVKGRLTAWITYMDYSERRREFIPRRKSVKNFAIDNGILSGEGYRGVFVTYKKDSSKQLVLVKGHEIDFPEHPEVSHVVLLRK